MEQVTRSEPEDQHSQGELHRNLKEGGRKTEAQQPLGRSLEWVVLGEVLGGATGTE